MYHLFDEKVVRVVMNKKMGGYEGNIMEEKGGLIGGN